MLDKLYKLTTVIFKLLFFFFKVTLKITLYSIVNNLFFFFILTLTAGAAASSTNKVTKKKPWALSPPGILTSNSKLLNIKKERKKSLLHTPQIAIINNNLA